MYHNSVISILCNLKKKLKDLLITDTRRKKKCIKFGGKIIISRRLNKEDS